MNDRDLGYVLRRGVVEIIVEEELLRLLESGKRLRLKMGFDPELEVLGVQATPVTDEVLLLAPVGVPNPLGDVGYPALASQALDPPGDVVVTECILAAEDLLPNIPREEFIV